MSTGNVVVSQDAPAKNNLWIQPKGTARFWNGSIWKVISGSGGGGGGEGITITDLWKQLAGSSWEEGDDKIIEDSHLSSNIVRSNALDNYYTKTESDSTFIKISWFKKIFQLYDNTTNPPTAIDPNNDFTLNDNFNLKSLVGFWTEKYISALGLNNSSGGGGGGMDIDAMWEALTTYDSTPSHIINNDYLNIRLQDLPVIPLNGNDVSGILPITKGGTGANDAAGARTNLGLGTMATESASDYLPLAGGTMDGPLCWRDSSALPERSSVSYFLNIDAFDDGGKTYWTSTANVATSLDNQHKWVRLSGDTMTGVLNLKANQYSGLNGYALNLNNSDIVNVNSILTSDTAESFGEGILFYRSASTWDCLSANGGIFYFGSNKAYGAAFAGDAQINCGYVVVPEMIYNSGMYAYGLKCGSNVFGFRTANGAVTGPHILSNDGNLVFGNYIWDSNHWCTLHYTYNTTVDYLSFMPCSSNKSLYVGIGTNSPSYKLSVIGDIGASSSIGITQTTGSGDGISLYGGPSSNPAYGLMFATTTNYGKFGDLTGSWATYFTMDTTYGSKLGWAFRIKNTNTIVASLSTDGNFCAKGGVTALATSSSDKRLKKEIKPFNAKQIIDKLNPVEFEWNKKANKYNSNLELNKKNYGLIAQDSDNIIDDFVFNLPDGKGYKGVRYEKLIPILLQAIKEQNEKIEDLEYEINVLKGFYK